MLSSLARGEVLRGELADQLSESEEQMFRESVFAAQTVSQSGGRVGLRPVLCSVTEAEEQREGRDRELGASECLAGRVRGSVTLPFGVVRVHDRAGRRVVRVVRRIVVHGRAGLRTQGRPTAECRRARLGGGGTSVLAAGAWRVKSLTDFGGAGRVVLRAAISGWSEDSLTGPRRCWENVVSAADSENSGWRWSGQTPY